MTTRPTNDPRWAYDPVAPTDLVDPGAKRATGWLPSERPPAQFFNHQWNVIGQWLDYLAGIAIWNWFSKHLGTDDNDVFFGAAVNETTGVMVVVGRPNARCVWRSVLGGRLVEQSPSGGAFGFADVAFGAGLFVAVRDNGPQAESSPDGVTWTVRTTGAGTHQHDAIAFSTLATLFCTVGPGGNVATSANGTAWTDRTMAATTEDQHGIAHNEVGLWVSVGNNGDIHTSPDGITWTQRTSGTGEDLHDVVYSSVLGLWIVVGDNGTILTSPNGIAWTARTSGLTTEDLRAVGVDERGILLAGGINSGASYQGFMITSRDGLAWETVFAADTVGAEELLMGGVQRVLYSRKRRGWVAMGQGGDGAVQVSFLKESLRT